MGLFSKKDPTAGMSDAARHQPHPYMPPKDEASGRVACLVCHGEPDELLHKAAKSTPETEADMHWS
jgi:hypothetical protein